MAARALAPPRPGKLPGAPISHDSALEYGTDRVEIQAAAVTPGQKVVVVDDLLATGGTMAAAVALFRECEADVTGTAAIIELDLLNGRERFDAPFEALVHFDG